MMIKYKSDDGLENWKGRTMEKARQVKRVLLQAIKIAVGSSVAIYLAHILGLEYEASAGSITLDGLKDGQYRKLTDQELNELYDQLKDSSALPGGKYQEQWVATQDNRTRHGKGKKR